MPNKQIWNRSLEVFVLIWLNSVLIGSLLFVGCLSVAEFEIRLLIFYLFVVLYSAVCSAFMLIPGWIAVVFLSILKLFRQRFFAISAMSLIFGVIPLWVSSDLWIEWPYTPLIYLVSIQISVFWVRGRIRDDIGPDALHLTENDIPD